MALIIETSKIYGREILRGISNYQRLHGAWSIFTTERGQDDPDPAWLSSWQGDGIITRSRDMQGCREAAARGIAVVSLRHVLEKPDFPSLFPDSHLIAQRIVDHFFERGFRNYGYVGVAGNRGWERERRESFLSILHQYGVSSIVMRPLLAEAGLPWEEALDQIVAWVRTLPLPIGIMVNHDTQGVQILDACRRAGLRVPDDIAVVSVDNDPVLCELATPPLSSLDQQVDKLGFEAAVMLDKLMRGKKIENRNYSTEPGHVVVRQSSDVIAVRDQRLVKAIRFVRENACRGADVDAVARAAGMSRRALEKKFTQHINRTPLEEIQEMRFRRIRQLLLETDYVLPQVAEMAGFQYQEYLVRFFKKRTGMTPGQFRRKMRFDA
ncbi:LacI family transcriptional regulator [uncultured Defluviicoccus sp.]|uniref:LacI family transcriptional regulator n=1 Tax=metagenome TaxID=256318 RepID=A0A380TDN4_9ZZZZ|nr:LacI family transcriptional regulator [uncultured Defluviicoccus sp.]